MLDNQLLDALGFLRKCEVDFEDFAPYQHTAVGRLVREKSKELKASITAALTNRWNELIYIEPSKSRVVLKLSASGMSQLLKNT